MTTPKDYFTEALRVAEKAVCTLPLNVERKDRSSGYFTFAVYGASGKDVVQVDEVLNPNAKHWATFIATARTTTPVLAQCCLEMFNALKFLADGEGDCEGDCIGIANITLDKIQMIINGAK